jgi:uncharacterized protein YciI
MSASDPQPISSETFLRKTLYVVFTQPVKAWEEIAAVIPEHLRYQVSLEQRGIMFGAGPLMNEEGKPRGRGMIIIRANSFDEAKAIADADPMHARGVRAYSIDRWTMNEGTVTIKVTYSDQRMRIE